MFDEYKNAITSQMASLSGVSDSIVSSAIEIPKINTHGDLAIAVPRLRVKGNP
ncbi:hypothetical protein GGF37_006944, partial [Kickxella alabastrina]